MAFYDYYCEANKKTVAVWHSMKIRLKTWGEVCELGEINPGKTPKEAPVVRLVGGNPVVWKVKGMDKDQPPGKKLIV